MDLAPPSFVGFFPKRTEERADWLENPVVEEICSVSLCISDGPEDWVERWEHNDLGFYDSEALALDATEGKESGFDLYAYRMYGLRFDAGEVQTHPSPVKLACDLSAYEFLGHDAVSRSGAGVPNVQCFFECSPLSCNSGADVFSVNRHCLITELDNAYQACIEISKGKYEPGPYYLFEVYRRKEDGTIGE